MPSNTLNSTLKNLSLQYPDSYTLNDSNLEVLLACETEHSSSSQSALDTDIPMVPLDQLCAINFTSGSTGAPRANLKYWHTLYVGSMGNAKLLFGQDNSRVSMVGTIPPQHMWGFETSILLPLFANVSISFRTPFYPQDIATALQSVPEPRVLVSSPTHLNVLLKSGVQLTGLARIFSATAPVSQQLAQQLERRFNTRFLEVFGCSETGILASRQTASESLWDLSSLFKFRLEHNKTMVIADHLPEAVELQDVIECVDSNTFKWLGRHQDMIKIAGKRASLSDLNQRLLAIDNVNDGVIFAPESGQRLVAMVVAPGLMPVDILNELKAVVEPAFLPRPVYMVTTLPRLGTGKLPAAAILKLHNELLMKTRQNKCN